MSLLRLRTLVLVCSLATICCVTQPISKSNADGGRGDELPQKERWQAIDSSATQMGGATMKVSLKGNLVLVPVTIEYKGSEVDVLLLLDTGSSQTVVSTDIAGRLNIDLTEAKKWRVQVVGGSSVEARQVRLSAITVGLHTKKGADILVIKHTGPPVRYDGLLGMDLLRGLKYSIDFQRKTITWE